MRCFTIIIIALFFSLSSFSHTPDEIYYNFTISEKSQHLEIHFTPKSAIDLLKYLEPELKHQTVIKLEDYLKDFSDYFNNTILLSLDGTPISFNLTEHNLRGHDATLSFKLTETPQQPNKVILKITSYINIYQRIKNYVNININSQTIDCVLNTTKTQCIKEINSTSDINSDWINYIFYTIGVILAFVLMWKIVQQKSSKHV